MERKLRRVYIPDNLIKEHERCTSTLGIKSKSMIVRTMESAVGIIWVFFITMIL